MMRVLSLISLLLLATSFAQETGDLSTEELLQQGDFYYARGDCLTSQYLFQRALEKEPTNAAAMLGKGQALVCQGALDLGIEEYQSVLDTHPDELSAYVRLADAYREQYQSDPERYASRLSDALALLERAEETGESNAALSNMRGVLLYEQGNIDGARTALENAVQLEGDNASYQADLGAVYRSAGELEEALSAFKRAVVLQPESASFRNDLGAVYFTLERCDDAEFELRQAVEINENLLEANFNLARTLFDCEQVSESVPYFQKVIDIDAVSLPPAYTYLARAYIQQSQLDKAVTEATKGALLPPANAEAYYWLGQAYEIRGGADDLAKAKDAYERALEIDPDFASAREALSQL